MTNTTNHGAPPLEEVLYAFAIDDRKPNADLLDEYARRYPEHAGAITEFAIEITLDELSKDSIEDVTLSPQDAITVTPAVSRAMSRFQNRLHAAKSRAVASEVPKAKIAPAVNPFTSLGRDALRTFAKTIDANNVFAMKLRDRQIDAKTMPTRFIENVAAALNVAADAIVAHFAAHPLVQPQPQFYKADQKPEAGARQTFEQAVRSSGLSEEQQRKLLSL